MAPEYSLFGRRLFGLPDGFWIRSGESVWIEDRDEDLTFAQDASLSGQFAQQLWLRAMAQEADLGGIANSSHRWSLASNKSPTCTDVKIGDAVLFRKSQNNESAPRRRGPALILDIAAARRA